MKIFIFGIVASGKTTLAKRLSLKLRIPYYEGDCITWGFPGEERYKHTEEEQKDLIDNIDSNGDWIILRFIKQRPKPVPAQSIQPQAPQIKDLRLTTGDGV